MNGLPYYKAYPRDFIEGTIGMPFELKGAYRIVLDLIYMQGGNLPDDARYIAGLLGCSMRKWVSLRGELVARGKLVASDGVLTNKRARNELETLAKLQDNQREKARKPRKNKRLQQPRLSHTEPEPDTQETDVSCVGRKRATRLPDTWFLPMEWGQWAVEEGWPEQVVRVESEKFRDYWISKAGRDGAKLNWEATWRNWMRNSKQPKVINGGQNDRIAERDARFARIINAAAEGSTPRNWG